MPMSNLVIIKCGLFLLKFLREEVYHVFGAIVLVLVMRNLSHSAFDLARPFPGIWLWRRDKEAVAVVTDC